MGWTPDGKSLLFASDRRGLGPLDDPIGEGRPQGAPDSSAGNRGRTSGITASGALYIGVTISDRDIQVAPWTSTQEAACRAVAAIQTFIGSNLNLPGHPTESTWPMFRSMARQAPGPILAVRAVETGRCGVATRSDGFRRTRWAPDGDSFVFQGTDLQGGRNLPDRCRDGKASRLHQYTRQRIDGPQWFQDGQKIFYLKSFKIRANSRFWSATLPPEASGACPAQRPARFECLARRRYLVVRSREQGKPSGVTDSTAGESPVSCFEWTLPIQGLVRLQHGLRIAEV